MTKEELNRLKLLLPTENEIFDNETRHIYFNNSIGRLTDFVQALSDKKNNIWLSSDIKKDAFGEDCIHAYTSMGYIQCKPNEQCPILPLLELNEIDILKYAKPSNGFLKEMLEVEVGEYPQSIASPGIQYDLYMHKGVQTGKKYSIQIYNENTNELSIVQVDEYEYKGKKYVSIPRKYRYSPKTWYEVEPIKWIIDLKHNKLICKDTIIVGSSYNNWTEYRDILIYDMIYNTKEYLESNNQLSYRLR